MLGLASRIAGTPGRPSGPGCGGPYGRPAGLALVKGAQGLIGWCHEASVLKLSKRLVTAEQRSMAVSGAQSGGGKKGLRGG